MILAFSVVQAQLLCFKNYDLWLKMLCELNLYVFSQQ